jgi:glutaredoxin
MENKKRSHLSYRFMPMIILSYLFINLYLILIGATWCKSEGCEVSKSLLNIEQTELYTLAIIAFGILLFIGLRILKTNSEQLKELYKLGIFAIMICETIFLSYLYFKSGTLCISCFIFYSLVIINYILIDPKDKKVFIIFFIIAAMALLNLDGNAKSNPSISAQYTLLQSESCEHCKKVKEFLKENIIEYKKEDYANYDGLFSSLNITQIPVLIVKKNENNLIILNGVSEIIQYLNENEVKIISTKLETTPTSSTTQISFDDKEGCEINFLKNELENCKE